MRDRFGQTLVEIMREREDVIYVTGDVGNSKVAAAYSAGEFEGRVMNAGIAEQSMMGIAAGMALEGKTVVVNSIGNFPTLRCLEQIRDDVCYHNLNVKVCSTGGGLAYGVLGVTHDATEDLSVMAAMPQMKCLVPGDPDEVEWATRAMLAAEGPFYLRVGYHGEPCIDKPDGYAPALGRAIRYHDGERVALLACGTVLEEAEIAARELAASGISCALCSFPTLKPLDAKTVRHCVESYELIVTVEENVLRGGFGSAVAQEIACMNEAHARLVSLGLDDFLPEDIGSQKYLREQYGLDAVSIVERVKSELEG